MSNNTIINGMWIGTRLSLMERLTIKSFLDHGHRFILWAYDELENDDLPHQLELRNAAEILPRERVFSYTSGEHAGSYAGFSDIFRYKLLHELGGWWVDMDVTCMRPFEFDQPYVFRRHGPLSVVGNMIKVPRHSRLMRRCYDWASRHIDESNQEWLKPVHVLEHEYAALKLERYRISDRKIAPDCGYCERMFRSRQRISRQWYMIHWCNEVFSLKGLDKDRPVEGSTYHDLLRRHGLV